jgi:putative Mn2+ efflux pump MntP
MRTVKKIMDRMTRWSTKKIVIFYTILYTIVLGVSAFVLGLWYGATIEGALRETLVVAVLTAVVMTFFSLLILRYSRKHFENPPLKHQGNM